MKHLLNNISEEEKNSILKQHGGGMKIFNENFHKMVNKKLGHVDLYEQTVSSDNSSTENTRQLSDIDPNIIRNSSNVEREAYTVYQGGAKYGISVLNLFKLLANKVYEINKDKEGKTIESLYMRDGGNRFKALVPDNTEIKSNQAYREHFGTPTLTYGELKRAIRMNDKQMADKYNRWLDTKLKA